MNLMIALILGPGRLYPRIRTLGAGSLEDSNRRPMAREWDIRKHMTRPKPWAGEIHNSLVRLEKQKLSFRNHAVQYFEYMTTATIGRFPFTTEKGYLGFGSKFVLPGDHVVVLLGSDVPVVPRKTGEMVYTFDCRSKRNWCYVWRNRQGNARTSSTVRDI